MNRTALVIGISLFAGFAVAALVFTVNRPAPVEAAATDPGLYFDQGAATEERIAALEAAVAQERNARLLLEEELQAAVRACLRVQLRKRARKLAKRERGLAHGVGLHHRLLPADSLAQVLILGDDAEEAEVHVQETIHHRGERPEEISPVRHVVDHVRHYLEASDAMLLVEHLE